MAIKARKIDQSRASYVAIHKMERHGLMGRGELTQSNIWQRGGEGGGLSVKPTISLEQTKFS